MYYNCFCLTIKIMNEFIDIGSEIIRPRRSQQEIFIQRLRKRVDPIFKNYKNEVKPSSHYSSLDPFKKYRSNRIKTCQFDQQNQFQHYSELNDSFSSVSHRSKRTMFCENGSLLQEEGKKAILLRPRRNLLPKLKYKKIELVSLTGERGSQQTTQNKLATLANNLQLVTFYPFKCRKQ